jgi:hypothetical protein
MPGDVTIVHKVTAVPTNRELAYFRTSILCHEDILRGDPILCGGIFSVGTIAASASIAGRTLGQA